MIIPTFIVCHLAERGLLLKKKLLETILEALDLDHSYIQSFSSGAELLQQGQESQNIIFLIQGSVEVNQYDKGGRKNISTYLHGPQFLGLIEHLTQELNIFSQIRSLTKGSYLSLSPNQMDTILSIPVLSKYFLEYLAYLNQNTMSLRSKERLMNKKTRLLDFFYEFTVHSHLPVKISLSKQDISDLLQIPSRSLYRYLSNLEKEGFFLRKGSSIWVYDKHLKKIREELNLNQ